jgi:hypothetical protein
LKIHHKQGARRMSFWTAIVIIVAIGTISEIYRSRLKANSVKTEESYQKLTQRMVSLEKRMANLETIVLEKEKSRKFSEL